jgi:hypothetical protein
MCSDLAKPLDGARQIDKVSFGGVVQKPPQRILWVTSDAYKYGMLRDRIELVAVARVPTLIRERVRDVFDTDLFGPWVERPELLTCKGLHPISVAIHFGSFPAKNRGPQIS